VAHVYLHGQVSKTGDIFSKKTGNILPKRRKIFSQNAEKLLAKTPKNY